MVFVDGAAVNKKGRLAEMSRERKISLERNTAETKISLSIDLDGTGKYQVDTGCGFLNHMLELFARHGRFDLTLKCDGDTQVDYHHTTEDIGIAMGQAILEALGDKKGIRRYGSFLLPMDETLVMTALDLSGRSYLVMDVEIPTEKVGDFDTELVKEFMIALSSNSRMTLHFKMFHGENSHHIIEAMFKMTEEQLMFYDEIDTSDLFPGEDKRERIMIFEVIL